MHKISKYIDLYTIIINQSIILYRNIQFSITIANLNHIYNCVKREEKERCRREVRERGEKY